jgi:hypothetical protein
MRSRWARSDGHESGVSMSIPEFGLSESMVLKGGRINGRQGWKGLARPSVGGADLEGRSSSGSPREERRSGGARGKGGEV